MKIGLISDTHGNWAAIDQAVSIAQKMDMWLHMGDCTPDAEYLQSLIDVPVYGVAGNCDWPTGDICYKKIVEAADHRIFITHGHNYGVRYTQEYIMEAAESQNADIAVYGHTHIVEYLMGPPIILNPGSASRPRDDTRGSFMVMELERNFEPKITVIRMKPQNQRYF
ncbi:MAG: YfcE family phosphodiesterase [Selenomonadaceae bacterium]|nr:YfcE family phosphodiesterase [Selenomonadaceae bacterium]